MPRPRAHQLFEIGGQWIARDPGSPFLHRFWTEPGTRRTRRQSLRTEDLEQAKRLLAEIIVKGAPKTSRTSLAVVLHKYFDERTDKLPSGKNARLAGRTLLSYLGETVRVEAITEAKQKEFAEWSIQQGHSLGYISRNLSVLSAALAFSKIDRKIIFKEAVMVERWALGAKARIKRLTPSDEELARFLAAEMPKGLWRWCVISLLTGARPAAAMELTPSQRNRDNGTLDLNPAGRRQNKKYRANVREPLSLKAWLDSWEVEMREERAKREKIANPDISGDTYCGYATIESVQTMIDRLGANPVPIQIPIGRRKLVGVFGLLVSTQDCDCHAQSAPSERRARAANGPRAS